MLNFGDFFGEILSSFKWHYSPRDIKIYVRVIIVMEYP